MLFLWFEKTLCLPAFVLWAVSCELLERLTNWQLIMLAGMLQPVSDQNENKNNRITKNTKYCFNIGKV
jgi:hypothetical protein